MSRIAYVCEGGGSLGWGHVGRGRALAERESSVSLLIGRGFGEIQDWIRSAGATFRAQQWDSADVPFSGRSASWEYVVVDAYDVSNRWIAETAFSSRVVVVDDWQRRSFESQVLVNPNIGADAEDYSSASFESGLFGPKYAFVRREIVELRNAVRSPSSDSPRVLLTLGGSDPFDATAAVVDAFVQSGIAEQCTLDVVIGSSYSGRLLSADGTLLQKVRMLRQPPDFSRRLATADVVVCGGSVTSYEAACLGRPFVPVAIVGNQRRITAAWAERGVGFDVAFGESGWASTLVSAVERSLSDLGRASGRARELMAMVDGLGAERVLEVLK